MAFCCFHSNATPFDRWTKHFKLIAVAGWVQHARWQVGSCRLRLVQTHKSGNMSLDGCIQRVTRSFGSKSLARVPPTLFAVDALRSKALLRLLTVTRARTGETAAVLRQNSCLAEQFLSGFEWTISVGRIGLIMLARLASENVVNTRYKPITAVPMY